MWRSRPKRNKTGFDAGRGSSFSHDVAAPQPLAGRDDETARSGTSASAFTGMFAAASVSVRTASARAAERREALRSLRKAQQPQSQRLVALRSHGHGADGDARGGFRFGEEYASPGGEGSEVVRSRREGEQSGTQILASEFRTRQGSRGIAVALQTLDAPRAI